jgi:hypothetical protein
MMAGPTEQSKQEAKRKLQTWCLLAPHHDRKRHHTSAYIKSSDVLPEGLLDIRLSALKLPTGKAPTDQELDAAETLDAKNKASHGPRQKRKAKQKPRQQRLFASELRARSGKRMICQTRFRKKWQTQTAAAKHPRLAQANQMLHLSLHMEAVAPAAIAIARVEAVPVVRPDIAIDLVSHLTRTDVFSLPRICSTIVARRIQQKNANSLALSPVFCSMFMF